MKAKATYGYCTCSVCGGKYTARIPSRGDGSVYLPAVHKKNGETCIGSYLECLEDTQ